MALYSIPTLLTPQRRHLTRECTVAALAVVCLRLLLFVKEEKEKQISAGNVRPPAYGALAYLYAGKDVNQLLQKILEVKRAGIIDEYYDIKASDPSMDFHYAR